MIWIWKISTAHWGYTSLLTDLMWEALKLFLNWVVNADFSSSSVMASSFIWSLENHLVGSKAFTKSPTINERAPIPMQRQCYQRARGAHLTTIPPYSTRAHWTTMVKIRMSKKSKLLKKPAKTLYSFSPNFLELISLNTCMKTKLWKIIV